MATFLRNNGNAALLVLCYSYLKILIQCQKAQFFPLLSKYSRKCYMKRQLTVSSVLYLN